MISETYDNDKKFFSTGCNKKNEGWDIKGAIPYNFSDPLRVEEYQFPNNVITINHYLELYGGRQVPIDIWFRPDDINAKSGTLHGKKPINLVLGVYRLISNNSLLLRCSRSTRAWASEWEMLFGRTFGSNHPSDDEVIWMYENSPEHVVLYSDDQRNIRVTFKKLN